MKDRVLFLTLTFILVSGCATPQEQTVVTTSMTQNRVVGININIASGEELTRIPHVGEKLAAKIVEHREANGPFRRVEHLMLIRGISDTRFRKIRPLVRVE